MLLVAMGIFAVGLLGLRLKWEGVRATIPFAGVVDADVLVLVMILPVMSGREGRQVGEWSGGGTSHEGKGRQAGAKGARRHRPTQLYRCLRASQGIGSAGKAWAERNKRMRLSERMMKKECFEKLLDPIISNLYTFVVDTLVVRP